MEGRTAILGRPQHTGGEVWLKFHEVPNPAFGKENLMHQYRLQSNLSESSFAGK